MQQAVLHLLFIQTGGNSVINKRKRRILSLLMSVIMLISLCNNSIFVSASDEAVQTNEDTQEVEVTQVPESTGGTEPLDSELPSEAEVTFSAEPEVTLPEEPEVTLPEETAQTALECVDGIYIISSPEDFVFVRNNLNEKYQLGADIDLSGVEFLPVGTAENPFTGNFDGNGFSISNLVIQSAGDYAGFFGVTSNAKIKGVTLNHVTIIGNDYVGSLAGYITGERKSVSDCVVTDSAVSGANFTGGLIGATDDSSTVSSTIIQNVKVNASVQATGNKAGGIIGYIKGGIYGCTSEGSLKGADCTGGIAGQSSGGTLEACSTSGTIEGAIFTGGLVGMMNGSTLEQCYSLCEIQGTSYVGGLLGESSGGVVENCFLIGKVTGNSYVGGLIGQCTTVTYLIHCYVSAYTLSNDSNVGGLCSKEDNLQIQSSFFDTSVSELDVQATSSAGLLTAQMRKQETYAGWNFSSIWSIDEDQTYPYLAQLAKPEAVAGPPLEEDLQGEGTLESPYVIKTKKHLLSIQNNLSAYYVLGADINLGGIEWTPVGTSTTPFTGDLDGAGYTISNFSITKNTVNNVGFFGVIQNAGIHNITFSWGKISGKTYAGTVAGLVNGTNTVIEHVTVTDGTVEAASYAGGLFGKVTNAWTNALTGCSVSVNVKATGDYAGGIAAYMNGGITRSYVTGNVSGANTVGGLAGITAGTTAVSESYSTASVSGTANKIGGLIGTAAKGNISNCFAAGTIAGKSIVGGLLGNASAAVTITNCLSAAKPSVKTGVPGGIAGSITNITISSSYYDGTVSKVVSSSVKQVSKTTVALQKASTYAGWDFDTIWTIEDGSSYPYFINLPKPDIEISEVIHTTEGSGTAEDPYMIYTVSDLMNMQYELSAYYKLANNIDLEGVEWTPVGTYTVPFTGGLDGNGYQIRNFTITKSTENYVGFFGAISNATIQNITFINGAVSGKSYVGTLTGTVLGTEWNITNCHIEAGYVNGTTYVGGLFGTTAAISTFSLSQCSSSAQVTGTGNYVGGLAGAFNGTAESCFTSGIVTGAGTTGGVIGYYVSGTDIKQCYSTSRVTGTAIVGGIVGCKNKLGNVVDCYVLGSVQGTSKVGGLIGTANQAVSLINCYAAAKISMTSGIAGGLVGVVTNFTVSSSMYDGVYSGLAPQNAVQVSRITDSMIQQSTYEGWDFETVWAMENGNSYPYLRSLAVPEAVTAVETAVMTNGNGTKESPYIIYTGEQLQKIKYELSAYYKLGNDIDLEGVEWEPIGTSTCPFSGGLDGAGYSISNFEITKGTVNYVGFFGAIGNAEVKALTLEAFSVNGKNYVGGLCGIVNDANAVIKDCHATNGRVSGASYVGGLIGQVSNSLTECISHCSTDIEVIGTDNYTGSLIGYLYGNLKQCFARGTVEGDTYVGGIAGYCVAGTISECYSIVKATNGTNVGGIAGYKTTGTIENCYALGSITGTNYIGGIVGNVSSTTNLTNCYSSVFINAIGTSFGGLCSNNAKIVMTSCYYDGIISGVAPVSKYDCSYITESLLQEETFAEWDFETVWDMGESTCPYLRNVTKPQEVTPEAGNFTNGKGTSSDPYEIETAQQLALIKFQPNAHFELKADIDYEGNEWEPVGKSTTAPFTGSLNGNGYTISNFKISKSTDNNIGFFGVLNNAVIENVNIAGAKVTGKNYVGSLIGQASGTEWIVSNCHVTDTRVAGVGYIGGVAGYVVNAAANGISDSSANVTVIGTGDRVGGLVGSMLGNIKTSYVLGNVQGVNYVGGVAGYSQAGVTSQCYVNADVTGAARTAGIAGHKNGGTILNCFSLGTVTGTNYVSGIVGISAANSYITNSYTAAVITGTGTSVGGVYGRSSYLTITNSYYNRTINPELPVVDAYARYTSALKRQANFIEWDFDTIWTLKEYKSYPSFQNMNAPEGIEGPVATDLPEGSGTQEDPYIIKTKQQLISVQYNLTAYYEVVNDIDLEGMEWTPLGTAETPFTGHINGNGFTISNFHVTLAENDYVGFFGVVAGAKISNIKLDGFQMTGNQYVGGFAGFVTGENTQFTNCYVINASIQGSSYVGGLFGKIENAVVIKCSSNAEVTAVADYVGGIAGWMSGSIEQSYSEGTLTGVNYVGGLVGYTAVLTIKNSFSLCIITGTEYVGGLIGGSIDVVGILNCYFAGSITCTGVVFGAFYGEGTNITTTDCYYDGLAAGVLPKSDTDPSRLTNGMRTAVNFGSWNFSSVWTIQEGTTYPYLRGMEVPVSVNVTVLDSVPSGFGTKANPYIIMTVDQLINIKYEVSAYYRLGADLDLAGMEWIPLGTLEVAFTGYFDGAGFTISNLTYNNADGVYVGLFGVIRNASIVNLTITTVSITASQYVGVLAGYAIGSNVYIYNCHVTGGIITAVTYAGGLIGKMECEGKGQMIRCSSDIEITCTGDYIGGLIGYLNGIIKESYAAGKVTGINYIGGIAGYSLHSYIEKSYSTCIVFGNWYLAGIVGYSWGTTVIYCYTLGTISGVEYIAGIIGFSAYESYITECYAACKIFVTGTFVGGLCSMEEYITVVRSYYDGLATGVIPKLTIDCCIITGIASQVTYLEWDFTSIWYIEEGTTYPYLRDLPRPVTISEINWFGRPQGTGTAIDPYIITTIDELINMKFDLDGAIILGADIDLEGAGWESLGSAEKPFTGVFDGNGHTISKFVINKPGEDNVGFFRVTDGAVIKNLILADGQVVGANKTGALIGWAKNTTVSGCSIENTTVTGKIYVGNLIGYLQGTVTDCSTSGIVTGDSYVGGITGYCANSTVSDSFTLGDVNGTYYVGGITGYSYFSAIRTCESISTVTGNNYIGGMAGYSNSGSVEGCQSFTTVNGKSYVGGILGYNNGATLEICKSLADTEGDVLPLIKENNESTLVEISDSFATVTGTTYVGGLIGYSYGGKAISCLSAGSVTGKIYVGGLIGYSVGAENEESISYAAVSGTRYAGEEIGYTKA